MNTYLNPDAIQDRSIEPIKLNSAIIEVTYAELKALRDNAQLIPGQQYRIIDFVTTAIASGTYKSVGKQFDVIVVADSENILNENARAIQHEGDTYFKDCNLAAWKLKYSLDTRDCDWVRTKLYINDGNEVVIADADLENDYVVFEDGTNALVDSDKTYNFYERVVHPTSMENMFVIVSSYVAGGRAVYYASDADFTVDKSRVYIADDDTTYYKVINENDIGTKYYVSTNYNLNTYIYKYTQDSVATPVDGEFDFYTSELSTYAPIEGILEPGYMGNDNTSYNTEFKGVIYRMIDEHNNDCPYDFKNIIYRSPLNISTFTGWYFTFSSVFPSDSNNIYATSGIGNSDATVNITKSCYNNTINSYHKSYVFKSTTQKIQKLNNNILGPQCYNNVFESDCHNNVLANLCHHNKFGLGCYNNSFGDECNSNSFGNQCYSNSFKAGCNYNSFENGCCYNSFGNYCWSNSFGNNSNNNSFGNDCNSNSFGVDCYSNSFESGCSSNSFEYGCNSNAFKAGCNYNSFGNYCYSNSFGNNCNYNSFGNYCYNNSFGNNCRNNSFGNNCNSNSFKDGCNSNSFGNYCYSNSFGNYCNSNSFGNGCANNSFGNECNNNSFGNECWSNTFGNECWNNTFGNSCNRNSFGNDFNSNSFKNYCYSNSFGNNCNYNSFGNYCANNSFRVGSSNTSNLRDHCNSNKFCDGCDSVILWNSTKASSTSCLQSVNVNLIWHTGSSPSSYYTAEIGILRSLRPINVYCNGYTLLAVDYGEKWRHITNSTTLTKDDKHIICDNTSAITITLPTGWNGAEYYIHKRCSTSITNTIKTTNGQYISYGGESSTTEQRATSSASQSLGTSKLIWDPSSSEWIRIYLG